MGLSFTAPLAGRDDWEQPESTNPYKFQSTHPLRGATGSTDRSRQARAHFNPRTPCGVRQKLHPGFTVSRSISIHAPLAGCDAMDKADSTATTSISIHAPLAGCDKSCSPVSRCRALFQSTHPLRGATAKAHKKMRHFCAKGINTSSLCAKNAHPAT